MEGQLIQNTDKDWLLVTDRSNLITIFSSGVVQLAHAEYQHRLDIRDEYDGRIVLFQGGIPADAVDSLKEVGGRTPVILRFAPEIAERLSEIIESNTGQVFSISDFPVSLTLLKAVEFLSVEDQKDSLERLSMLNSRGGEYVVSDSPFSAFSAGISTKDCMPANQFSDVSFTSHLDDTVGAIAAVLQIDVCSEKQLQVIGGIASDLEDIFNERQPDSAWLVTEAESEELRLKSEFDRWLWPSLAKQLLAVDSKEGFGGLAFLGEFINENTDLPEELRPVAYKWRDVVMEVLDNERDIPDFDGKGWPVQRAALLFLLRRTPDKLSGEDADEFDFTIRAVAVAFAGCLVGFMGLDENLRPNWPVCMSVVDSLIDGKREPSNEKLVAFKLELTKKSTSALVLVIGNDPYRKFDGEHSDMNEYVFSVAKRSGYELEIDCTGWKGSFTTTSPKKGKCYFLTRISQDDSLFRPIRIESECKRFTAITALSKLNRDVLVKLLTTGGTVDGRCRYSISISKSKNAIVAIKDQLPETMGRDEFFRHLQAVAVAVEDYKEVIKKK